MTVIINNALGREGGGEGREGGGGEGGQSTVNLR